MKKKRSSPEIRSIDTMAVTATLVTPAVSPRPSSGPEKSPLPLVPPRPLNRRLERSKSPTRFARSPLSDGTFLAKSPTRSRFPLSESIGGEPLSRSTSVELPSVGEEGKEYEGLEVPWDQYSSSPEQTRSVGEDVMLHAPRPHLSLANAKQLIMPVTLTNSDRASPFCIGRPGSNEALMPTSSSSLRKKASNASGLSERENHFDDDQGIPEIGKQVPMYPNAGDVQAPSPAPGTLVASQKNEKGQHHVRKTSSRGNLPPGSYGLHGHGVGPQGELEKAYFEKHPEALKQEHALHHYDRPNDLSLGRDALDKIVHETAKRGSGSGVRNYVGTPSDQVGWKAMDQSTSRVATPRLGSIKSRTLAQVSSDAASAQGDDKPGIRAPLEGEVMRIDEAVQESMFSPSGGDTVLVEGDEEYSAPILAEDEVAKHPPGDHNQPAVALPHEHLDAPNRPKSRPTSILKEASPELTPTLLEDVKQYEPLFPEDNKDSEAGKDVGQMTKPEYKQRFPSQDVWEDAPTSAHLTYDVSTPQLPKDAEERDGTRMAPPRQNTETPAQAFARQQEELAEWGVSEYGSDGFLSSRWHDRPMWSKAAAGQHLVDEHKMVSVAQKQRRPNQKKFPSQDIWEDTPDSLRLETTVSKPQEEDGEATASPVEAPPVMLQRPFRTSADKAPDSSEQEKPFVPERLNARTLSNGKPILPERPKPQIPARPPKNGQSVLGQLAMATEMLSHGSEAVATSARAVQPRPPVPVRAIGYKIAALQAGFMSDLNNRLRLGPSAPVKSEELLSTEDQPVDEKYVLLSDARKGRARGPQRKVPSENASAAPAKSAELAELSLSVSVSHMIFSIDPEEDILVCNFHNEAVKKNLVPMAAQVREEIKYETKDGAKVDMEKNTELTKAHQVDTTTSAEMVEQAEDQTPKSPADTETVTLVTNMACAEVVQDESANESRRLERALPRVDALTFDKR